MIKNLLKSKNRYFAVVVVVATILALFIYISVSIYISLNATIDSKIKSDAILVLGSKGYINGYYNPCLVSRVKKGVSLYKEGIAPKIIMSGGLDAEDNTIEAETMKKIAITHGVSEQDILTETKSTSTYENFVFTKELLRKHDIKSVVVVTEAFHQTRAQLIAKSQNINATFSPATDSICWNNSYYWPKHLVREHFAFIWYWVRGYL